MWIKTGTPRTLSFVVYSVRGQARGIQDPGFNSELFGLHNQVGEEKSQNRFFMPSPHPLLAAQRLVLIQTKKNGFPQSHIEQRSHSTSSSKQQRHRSARLASWVEQCNILQQLLQQSTEPSLLQLLLRGQFLVRLSLLKSSGSFLAALGATHPKHQSIDHQHRTPPASPSDPTVFCQIKRSSLSKRQLLFAYLMVQETIKQEPTQRGPSELKPLS